MFLIVTSIVLLGLFHQAFTVDRNKFRNCDQTGFCKRHREKEPKCTVYKYSNKK